ncbi:hypothetical protein SEA_DARDANUS_66 [Gordonia phage Dardanus]|uniref:DUF6378 domain-containing protein n=1 Tax=Gordonia phage Dardanus TaxID=2588489 RepID=A0A514CX66_9CAUD|nr:phosphofructokinase [Gordonia phage Dardanus]QDH85103.1 hypothetical protein SEA_DARDANUS_66 [Gordonia phage Dardanus]
MNKGEVLAKASELVAGQRAKDYGDARENHQRIADLWTVVLGRKVEPHEVAACMVALKLARLVETPDHADSWVDMAGYAGIGGEIATEPDGRNLGQNVTVAYVDEARAVDLDRLPGFRTHDPFASFATYPVAGKPAPNDGARS